MDSRIYRVAPEYHRCAIYVIVAFALVDLVAYWIADLLPERDPWGTAVVYVIIAAVPLAMIVPLRWAVYVDGSGVARRFLIGWELWSWSDFASGRIEKRGSITFADPSRPWWRRTLCLDYIADAELKKLTRLINEHYRLPPPPALPETVEIKYGFRRKAELRRNGILLTVRGKTFSFAWSAVQRLRITRIDPLRRDFDSLELTLPGHEIELKFVSTQGGAVPTWSSAAPEVVSEFLLAQVPTDRIAIDIADESPVRMEDIDRQIKVARSQERGFRIGMSTVVLIGFVTLPIAFALEGRGVFPTLVTAGIYALTVVPVCWIVDRRMLQKIAQLEKWRAEFENEPRHFNQLKR